MSDNSRSNGNRRIGIDSTATGTGHHGSNASVRHNGADGSQIPARTVCLILEMKKPGNRRRVPSAHIEVDADRSAMSVSKTLLDSPQLMAVRTLDASIREYVASRGLPSLFKRGVTMVPLALVAEVDAKLAEFQTRRGLLVERFLEAYPDLVVAAQSRLRAVFNPADYPPPEQVRAAFSFTWRYLAFDVPSTLSVVDRAIFSRERDKAAAQWSEAAAVIQTLLRTHMAELVTSLSERLQPDANGNTRSFRNSSLAALNDFLATFDARNVTDDGELAMLVGQARGLLTGVSPQGLRRSDSIRATVQSGFAEIKRNLDAMTVETTPMARPTRRIVLEPVQSIENGTEAAQSNSAAHINTQPIDSRPVSTHSSLAPVTLAAGGP